MLILILITPKPNAYDDYVLQTEMPIQSLISHTRTWNPGMLQILAHIIPIFLKDTN